MVLPNKLRRLFLANAPYKLLSLILALVAWSVVQQVRFQELRFILPLEFTNIPDYLVLSGEPKSVHVRVQAPKEVAQDLSSQLFQVSLSLENAQPGENVIRISPSAVQAPRGVEVIGLSPDFVEVNFDYHRIIGVVPVFAGTLAPGYTMKGYRVVPDRVEIIGRLPEEVSAVVRATTPPISIYGETDKFQVTSSLEPLPSGVRYVGEPTVRVEVDIQPEQETVIGPESGSGTSGP